MKSYEFYSDFREKAAAAAALLADCSTAQMSAADKLRERERAETGNGKEHYYCSNANTSESSLLSRAVRRNKKLADNLAI